MRIVVFSDVHGNAFALKRFHNALSSIQHDMTVFLGDVFGYYYDQKECIELLKAIPNLVWLKGNHDVKAFSAYDNEEKQAEYIERYGHSYDRLRERFSKDVLSSLNSLPSSYRLTIDGRTFGFFHGSPQDSLEFRVYNDTPIESESIKEFDIIFVGHTHCKIDRMVGNTRILSPGSIGQPRDGKGYGFLIYDTITDECIWKNIQNDNDKLRAQIDKNDKGLNKLYDVLRREEKDLL